MRKLHPDGSVKKYPKNPTDDWQVRYPWGERRWWSTKPNLACECGSDQFKVCWWDYPHCGGYCRIVCVGCGKGFVLIDEYA